MKIDINIILMNEKYNLCPMLQFVFKKKQFCTSSFDFTNENNQMNVCMFCSFGSRKFNWHI